MLAKTSRALALTSLLLLSCSSEAIAPEPTCQLCNPEEAAGLSAQGWTCSASGVLIVLGQDPQPLYECCDVTR